MLTFPQIISKTDKVRRLNAKFVRIVKFKSGYTPDGLGYAACQSFSTHHYDVQGHVVKNPDRNKYVTVVKFLDSKLHVQCSCSCPDFLFRWEYALHQKGAAELEYSNGQAPVMTNPQNRVATCKHLVALFLRFEPKLKR